MATLKQLRSWTARAKLTISYTPYWAALRKGLHVGYRRGTGTGSWLVRRYLGSGKYHSEIIASADDGALVADGREVLTYDQAVEAAQGPRKGPLTVAEAITGYIDFLKAHKRTAYDAELRLARHVLPLIGSKRVADLQRADVERVQRRMIKRDPADFEVERRSKATSNRTMTNLRAALNRARRDPANQIPSDSAWRDVQPFARVNAARTVFLSLDQQRRLINVCSGGFRNLVVAALLTGARPPGELNALRVRDFHRASGTLSVPAGKTGARTVTLNQEAVAFFDSITAGRDPDELLLVRDDGTPWINRAHIPPMKAAVAKAKLPVGTTAYSLRHSFISSALAGGLNIQLLAENTGTSVAMVERHYGKFTQAARRELIEAAVPKLGLAPGNVRPLRRGG